MMYIRRIQKHRKDVLKTYIKHISYTPNALRLLILRLQTKQKE